ncbi:MAG: D-aminoacyl-tRNA deacylase [Oscillospiraceae bacterium]|nr:D-aminoacyl-tRNA deacylase [Oscillospiraceae bacterium]
MRAVLTRVTEASVTIDGEIKGAIGEGFLVLLGIHQDDGEAQAVKLADKVCGLRIFRDENDQMNRSLADYGGKLLVISQFTLYGNCKKGRRPEFLSAARPETAIPLYERFLAECRDRGFEAETGEFGAYMQVQSVNDGPVTLVLDTDAL